MIQATSTLRSAETVDCPKISLFEDVASRHRMNISIVESIKRPVSATFISTQCEHLPANVTAIYGQVATIEGQSVRRRSLSQRIRRALSWEKASLDEGTRSYVTAFRRLKTDVAVAQYGPVGVRIMEACRKAGIPLIVHFRGYDASIEEVLEKHRASYPRLFEIADGLIAVSHQIEEWLLRAGAPRNKVHYNPSGVDCNRFQVANPVSSAPIFLHVGRFVEKKAPHLLLTAFRQVLKECPEARLKMIGEGPLLGICRDLSHAFKIDHAVTFLGAQSHEQVQRELQECRGLVQHSLRASNGDAEGTPNSIMEAGASGLPVVSTRHAGIPDVVVEGKTGFLVDERDVHTMADHIITLARDPQLAATMGRAARSRIVDNFSMERSVNKLWQIIESCRRSS